MPRPIPSQALLAAMATAAALSVSAAPPPALAQVAPRQSEVAEYTPLLAAAHRNDAAGVTAAIAAGADPNLADRAGRTAVHIAAHASAHDALRALVAGGADIRALDNLQYDAITIAAVADDLATMELAIELGGDAGAITSPYEGTALIAAAHLGHAEVVKSLIEAGAPLDHVNNLHWTALIEAVVLGDGGPDHVETVRALVAAGANQSLTDRAGRTPLELAKAREYAEMVALLEN